MNTVLITVTVVGVTFVSTKSVVSCQFVVGCILVLLTKSNTYSVRKAVNCY